ncbi:MULTISPECIES: efflux RND transporter permease subunit [Mogibacterium]|uniref:efflux RND transporter permease subunit n=1 Tax=Mogibacterium TaxID=86331 RepID=UPI0024096733|nr:MULTISPECIES: MMPL family transporter [Mogibacterium]MCI7124060.1 MMPL family transporter [Mogibacterium sp.]MDD6700537.1 MMPL family transporter [Mogibacterium kristiansenii]
MKFGKVVVKLRHAILVIALILIIPSAIGMAKTHVNYDMLSYLPSDMESVKGQDLLMDEFHKGGFSILVLENMKTDDVTKLKKDIEKVDHVESIVNLQDVVNPSIPISMYPKVVQDNINNKNATMLVTFYDTGISDEHTLNAVDQIRKMSNKDTYVAGMTSMVLDLKNIAETEEIKYVAVAVALSLLVMMLLLDSYVAPFLFLLSIGLAILYNMGSNIMFGEISYITKAIAAVLQLGVTMDYSIFLWHSYMEKLDDGIEPKPAMAEAINATLISVTGSSVTTIAGFLALCFMTYKMGMDLGLVMAKGVVFGVVCSVTVLPVMILFFTRTLQKTRHKTLIPSADRLSHKLTSRYGIYILCFGLLLAPALYGYAHMNTSYDLTKMVVGDGKDIDKEMVPFYTANKKLSKDFGINTSYIIIADANMSAKDGRSMSEEIKDVKGVKSVLGVDGMLGSAIPRNMLPDELNNSMRSDKHQMILVNSKYRISTDKVNRQVTQVNSIVHKYDKNGSVIGEAPSTKDLIQLTSKDFQVVNWISIGLVFLIIFFVLSSISLPFILILVIELAIYINLGICGFTGVELPFLVPVCVTTIQLGSTVDYAILMSTRYKTERMGGLSKRESIDIAVRTSMPSIMTSALGFFASTFGVSKYSNVYLISTMCSLMARGAIISMITVIFLLPSMLMAFDRIICKTTRGMKGLNNEKA